MRPQEQMDRSALCALVLAFFEPEIKSWRGEQPLGKIFWGYGVLASTGFGVLYALSVYGDDISLQQTLLPCIGGYTFWVLVSLWRSSEPVMSTLWGALARQLTVVWAVNTVLILTFLQLGLMERYLGILPS